MDNIGGYNKIEVYPAENWIEITLINGFYQINYLDPFFSLPFNKESAQITAVPDDTGAGLFFTNDAECIIPYTELTAGLKNILDRYNNTYCVIRFVTNNNEVFILGSKNYPLTMLVEKQLPGSVSNLSGWKLTFKGISTHDLLESVL